MFPLLNFKSPTVFTKFTALGTVSVVYLIGFNTIQLKRCFDWSFEHTSPPKQWHFPAFTGLLTMSFFIHNSILTILACQQHPENNNLLNNFDVAYSPSSVARVLIFFQIFSIFPLIMYLIRSQISCLLYNNPWPG
ncbi:unnamed protein product [Angiostrongylus costaricensis]|uniref:Aa_trans domain-containing protein n=1 Tax=Angiostrongylus costaricensis TaxID=334426 RepID=A0A0R3PF64_ANGCS|nr:unnamed protein product [Angiostrongylus costaricensis]